MFGRDVLVSVVDEWARSLPRDAPQSRPDLRQRVRDRAAPLDRLADLLNTTVRLDDPRLRVLVVHYEQRRGTVWKRYPCGPLVTAAVYQAAGAEHVHHPERLLDQWVDAAVVDLVLRAREAEDDS